MATAIFVDATIVRMVLDRALPGGEGPRATLPQPAAGESRAG